MKIAIRGASGLIGAALSRYFASNGHRVTSLEREGEWDLEGEDVLLNLAGENISSGRWTEKKKEKIRASRLETTRRLAELLKRTAHPPKIWINASAIGYYGDRGGEEIAETSAPGEGFLAAATREWEGATEGVSSKGIRVVTLRIGVVLSKKGGALGKMGLPFKLGLGGILGSGEQYMSWIDLDDLVRGVDHVIQTDSLRGPVNFTAPHPVTNREFTRTLGKVLHRPTLFPVPAFAVKLLFGEMGEELLLHGAQVFPKKLLASGFSFLCPTLEESLRNQLS